MRPAIPLSVGGSTLDLLSTALAMLAGEAVTGREHRAQLGELRRLWSLSCVLQAQVVRRIGVVHVSGAVGEDGFGSTVAWLRARLRLDGPTASRLVRAAGAVDPDPVPETATTDADADADVDAGAGADTDTEGGADPDGDGGGGGGGVAVGECGDGAGGLAATGRAFVAGHVSVEHVAAITDVRRDLGDEVMAGGGEKLLLDSARTDTPAAVRRLGRELLYRLDPDRGERRDRRLRDERWLQVARTFHGTVAIQGLLDPVSGESVINALAAYTPPADAAAVAAGYSAGQRRADALTDLCAAALASLTPPGTTRPPDPGSGTGTGTGQTSPAGPGQTSPAGPGQASRSRDQAPDADDAADGPASDPARPDDSATDGAAPAQPAAAGAAPAQPAAGTPPGPVRAGPHSPTAGPPEGWAPGGWAPGGGLMSWTGRAHPTVIVTIPIGALLGVAGSAPAVLGQQREPISASTARRLACDAHILPTVLGSAGQVLDLGHSARLVTPAQRRALAIRDRGCRFPGCTRGLRFTQAHHVWHWAEGGPTNLTNMIMLCAGHHALVHDGRWRLDYHAASNTVTAHRPDGTRLDLPGRPSP
jgi:Domain of unknown function (DUF222)